MSSLQQESLCQTLKELAQWTNRIIAKGYGSGLGILEETITDFTLNEIAFRHPEYIYTKKFSRKQEGCESGADWLWCIGSPGAWLSILVQAKIVNPKTKRCRFLDYGTTHGKQFAIFIKYARTHNLLPLYCIYSLIEDTIIPGAKALDSLSGLETSEWACSFIIPKYVKQLATQNQKGQADLLRYGIPWMFPFYEATNTTGEISAHGVAKSFHKVYDEFAKRDRNSKVTNRYKYSSTAITKSKKDLRTQWASIDPRQVVTTNFPSLIIRLLKSQVKYDDAPVSEVSIISSTPIDVVFSEQGILPLPDEELPIFRGQKNRGRIF